MKFIILFATLFFIGCENNKSSDGVVTEKEVKRKMGWLYTANPRKDFENSIKNDDFRFMGVYGYSLTVPNLKIACIKNIEEEVNPIQGTSDAIENYEHAKLNAIAREYASHYNSLMLIYKREKLGFECNS